MKKYLETAKITFKSQLAYRFDIFLSMVFTVSKIILAYVLWSAVFGTNYEISGFTFNGMISYYIVGSFITQLDQSAETGWKISGEIRHGLFSKYIVQPISIFGYFTARTAGLALFLLSFNLLAAIVWTFLFGIELELTGSLSHILYAAALILLGLLFMMQLNYYIGILAFKFLDTGIFMMIKDNILQFAAGSLIPLSLLPAGILDVMKYFPFYHASYLPVMLLLGKDANEAPMGLAVLAFWNMFFWLLPAVAWKRL